MRKLCIFFLVLVLVGIALAQDLKVEITMDMEKGTGEITVTGKTFDEVWKGIIRALMQRKFRIEKVSKEDGMIQAAKKPGIFYEEGDTLTTWQIIVMEIDEEILITCSVTLGTDAFSAKKGFKKFCETLKECLSE